jgi:hypothetical protein
MYVQLGQEIVPHQLVLLHVLLRAVAARTVTIALRLARTTAIAAGAELFVVTQHLLASVAVVVHGQTVYHHHVVVAHYSRIRCRKCWCRKEATDLTGRLSTCSVFMCLAENKQ